MIGFTKENINLPPEISPTVYTKTMIAKPCAIAITVKLGTSIELDPKLESVASNGFFVVVILRRQSSSKGLITVTTVQLYFNNKYNMMKN